MEKLVLTSGKELNIESSDNFRGWDAADEYLLGQDITGKEILVIGDLNGALTCGFYSDGRNITTYTNSCLNEKFIGSAINSNGVSAQIITDFTMFPERVDYIVVKLPKSLDMLEYYLQKIVVAYKDVPVVFGGMVKYMPISMIRLLEKYYKEVKTSLAVKKARLAFCSGVLEVEHKNQFPKGYDAFDDIKVLSYPGVFSSEHLDLGTRFLLKHIEPTIHGSVIDLGCGSGVIGATVKKRYPDTEVVLTDHSYLAVESARETFRENGVDGTFYVMDILENMENESADYILCNPPFHMDTRILTDVALNMFKESKRVLKKGGILYVVANKHLGYHKKLRLLYHNLKRVADNEKFNIFSVRKV
ncbi:MAG: class I SAM-dependent methyltransferase [Spirochaetales bacterium]|nr:class I SAM-dependent methyltransferase [Spirochaetales bacterium]